MKLLNKSRWKTLDLKKLFTEVIRRNSKVEGKLDQWKKIEIEIISSRNRCYSGHAMYNGAYIRLRFPTENIDPVFVAWLFEHELYHIRGYHHNQLDKATMGRGSMDEWAWAKEYSIEATLPKSKPKEDIQLKRYNRILAVIQTKAKTLKRLQNQIKKWTLKKRYYEKTLVASGKLKPNLTVTNDWVENE